jgi:hypothetical protein
MLGACATTKTQLREAARAENPVAWPVGIYDVAGNISFTGAFVPAGENRSYHATLIVDPGNTVQLTDASTGLCGEPASVRGDRTGFGCGDASFSFYTDGVAIWGTVTRTISVQLPAGEMRCMQYRTDEQGNRTCVRWDRPRDQTRRETATGQLSVTAAG